MGRIDAEIDRFQERPAGVLLTVQRQETQVQPGAIEIPAVDRIFVLVIA